MAHFVIRRRPNEHPSWICSCLEPKGKQAKRVSWTRKEKSLRQVFCSGVGPKWQDAWLRDQRHQNREPWANPKKTWALVLICHKTDLKECEWLSKANLYAGSQNKRIWVGKGKTLSRSRLTLQGEQKINQEKWCPRWDWKHPENKRKAYRDIKATWDKPSDSWKPMWAAWAKELVGETGKRAINADRSIEISW